MPPMSGGDDGGAAHLTQELSTHFIYAQDVPTQGLSWDLCAFVSSGWHSAWQNDWHVLGSGSWDIVPGVWIFFSTHK